jgi:hypothetical protein
MPDCYAPNEQKRRWPHTPTVKVNLFSPPLSRCQEKKRSCTFVIHQSATRQKEEQRRRARTSLSPRRPSPASLAARRRRRQPGHRRPIRSRCRIYSTETTPGRWTEAPACSSTMTTHHADGRRRSHAQPRRRRSPRCRPGFGDLLLVCGHARMCMCTNRPIKKKGRNEAQFRAETSDITSLYAIRFLPHTLQ